MYDLLEYQNHIRGFYFPLDELPGKIVTTEDQLIESIKTDAFFFDKRYQDFNQKFNYLDDGNASNRVIEKLFFE
jgi:CDP-glycerol glycerophosphotransferase